MGYTTEFDKPFTITPRATVEEADRIRRLSDEPLPGSPRGYCQWVVTHDGSRLDWDGEEKFYNFVEWLEVIARYLGERGHRVSGRVTWQGEEITDRGTLEVCYDGDDPSTGFVDVVLSQERVVACPRCGHGFRLCDAPDGGE